MPESGIPSAVGLCLESEFRKVPNTAGAIGVADTNPHRFSTIEAGGGFPVRPGIVVPNDEIDGDLELKRTIKTSNGDYAGSFAFKADAENVYLALLGFFGKDVQTELVPGKVYKHVFTVNPKGFAPSFSIEEIFGASKNYGRLTSGCVINRLQMDHGEILIARYNAIGHRQIPNVYRDTSGMQLVHDFGATPTLLPAQMGGDGVKTIARTANPTYVDIAATSEGDGPFVFGNMAFGTETGFATGYMKINGVLKTAIDIMPGFSITHVRNIQSEQVGGSGFDPGAVVGNNYEHTGNLNLLFRDNMIPLSALRKSKIALNWQYLGIPVPAQTGNVQTVTLTGGPTGGTFTLSVTRGGSTLVTAPIAFDATGAVVQAALEALQNVGIGNVSVVGAASGPYTVTFAVQLGAFTAMVADGLLLTGAGAPYTVDVVVTDPGTGYLYSLEFHLPSVRFLEGGVDMPASQMISGGNWVAEKDAAAGYAIKITLVNSISNALLGGGAGSTGAAGGLGGWNNA